MSQYNPNISAEKLESAKLNLAAIPTCEATSRQSGKLVLANKIERLRKQADNLQTLYFMLPEQPTPEQDEAIWQIFNNL